ncbi:uracil-DNA glycosylase family protein [Pedobacter hiemivivus]|uniref:Uracil-DNA glycosylase family protein n=1 Tax=Pedobacter hiemivivus TaxID=2530454 RepID=A0A4R0NG74_9SPHI|nr:hypothetical protein [Pedobacter hiemivivus]TCC99539.1 hypothetical protein EZ444_02360 [Pedobacter hiemivivus]
MRTINHQLINQPFFVPKWKIKHLFLGTFNPEGGDPVRYFYGRNKNFTWKILDEVFPNEFMNYGLKLREDFFERLIANGVACMDMISSIEIADEKVHLVTGKGYSDSVIINNQVKRIYNTDAINTVIRANPNLKVYSTWGTGSTLATWRRELSLVRARIISLKSPSPVARVPLGTDKYSYVRNDWWSKILGEYH